MPWADQEQFDRLLLEEGPSAATNWLYRTSNEEGFLGEDAATRNLQWNFQSTWGTLRISVNRTKPEKDPRDIAAALEQDKNSSNATPCSAESDMTAICAHPDCVFCWDSPREAHHLRVRLSVGNQPMSLHFSPYSYFTEHCIVATREHRPMLIDQRTFDDLTMLCEMFPAYFFGSNADLPIVGGSILSHHHYQGGRYTFPLDQAQIAQDLSSLFTAFPAVSAAVMRWPLSTVRLTSRDRTQLVNAAAYLLKWWQAYSNEQLGIVAADADGTRHNTITPIVRFDGTAWALYLVLRCNITSPEYPLGVFHPHSEVHRVKKENIGLIEAMGLAILPPRLEDEFNLGGNESSDTYGDRLEVGALFTRGLEQCGVMDCDALASELSKLAQAKSTTMTSR